MRSVPTSELAWVLKDYEAAGEEPPERIQQRPEACEGELMTDEEVEEYVNDSIATIMILLDQGSSRVPQVHKTFVADLEYLLSIGRLELDEYNELKELENFNF